MSPWECSPKMTLIPTRGQQKLRSVVHPDKLLGNASSEGAANEGRKRVNW